MLCAVVIKQAGLRVMEYHPQIENKKTQEFPVEAAYSRGQDLLQNEEGKCFHCSSVNIFTTPSLLSAGFTRSTGLHISIYRPRVENENTQK